MGKFQEKFFVGLKMSEFINFFRGFFSGLKHAFIHHNQIRTIEVILPGYEKYRYECICGSSIEFVYD